MHTHHVKTSEQSKAIEFGPKMMGLAALEFDRLVLPRTWVSSDVSGNLALICQPAVDVKVAAAFHCVTGD